ncbi:MAG: CDP-alcohol phosphatidyltransferase family protein [Thermoleophilia bacterium]
MAATGASATRGAWLRMVPNALTLARLAALPVLLVVLARAPGPTSVTAGLIFGAVAVTDFLDGWLARALRAESAFGRIADPLADRLLVGVGLVGVILLDRMHWAAPVTLITRDVLLIAGFVALARIGVLMRVDMAGKVSSALTMFATGGCLLFAGVWVEVLMWIAVALALVTFAHYSSRGARAWRSARGGSISA